MLPKLDDAHVVITGKYNGFDVTLEGDVEDVVVDTEEEDEDPWVENFFSDQYADPFKTLVEPLQYVVKFKPKANGVQFVYKVQPKVVSRSASMVTENAENESVEKARRATGAPEDAQVYTGFDEENNTVVSFTWKENIYG